MALGVGALIIALARGIGSARRFHKGSRPPEPADPKISARIRLAWKRGHQFRKSPVFSLAAELPWYLGLKFSESLPGHILELGDAVVADSSEYGDAFTWRRGADAAWLDFHDGMPGDDQWRAFVNTVEKLPRVTAPAGVVVRVDAVRLLNNTYATIHDEAPGVAAKLEQFQKIASRKRLPLYIVVDNLDRLYGLRSIISRLNPDRLKEPLGKVRPNEAGTTAEFVSACISDCTRAFAGVDLEAGPAALTAPDEIARLEAPLIALCDRLSRQDGKGMFIRGLFLAAAAPGGDGVKPLLGRLPTFQTMVETLPVQPWFVRTLLRKTIPEDVDAARRAAGASLRLKLPAAAAGLLAGCVALSCVMTISFFKSREILLSARGGATPPESSEELQKYRELARSTRLKNSGWRLPRFGMNEPEILAEALERRYADCYFGLKAVPSIENIQKAVATAVKSKDSSAIGNALLLLSVTREGLGRKLTGATEPGKDARFLHSLVDSLQLASPEDMEQLDSYFTWASRQDWMPETHAALAELERSVLAGSGIGDVLWLAEWINTIPGLHGVETSRVWDHPPESPMPAGRIAPAWTKDGYRIAKGVLSAVLTGSHNPDARQNLFEDALDRYRAHSLEAWREAASVLWDDFRVRIPDTTITAAYQDALKGDDPAYRFCLLLGQELLPQFAQVEDGNQPALRRLRMQAGLMSEENAAEGWDLSFAHKATSRLVNILQESDLDKGLGSLGRRLAGSSKQVPSVVTEETKRWRNCLKQAAMDSQKPDKILESVRAQFQEAQDHGFSLGADLADPLRQAADPALRLHGFWRQISGGNGWDALSPLASLEYLRYLAARQAALALDAMWREYVYLPSQLTRGSDGDRLARLAESGGGLEQFLTGPAAGFWRWRDGKIVNSAWNKMDFMFDQTFLKFCLDTLRNGRSPGEELQEISLSVRSVSVDAGAKEQPTAVNFFFESNGRRQAILFENYRTEGSFYMAPGDDAAVGIEIVFPSLVVRQLYNTNESVEKFLSKLSSGGTSFGRGLFPEQRDALKRMGISRIVLDATVENGQEIPSLLSASATTIPASIITRNSSPILAPYPSTEFGPLAAGQR